MRKMWLTTEAVAATEKLSDLLYDGWEPYAYYMSDTMLGRTIILVQLKQDVTGQYSHTEFAERQKQLWGLIK